MVFEGSILALMFLWLCLANTARAGGATGVLLIPAGLLLAFAYGGHLNLTLTTFWVALAGLLAAAAKQLDSQGKAD